MLASLSTQRPQGMPGAAPSAETLELGLLLTLEYSQLTVL
jgi:hypothetical protein